MSAYEIHCGRPSHEERARAHTLSERLGAALRALCDTGFSDTDARAFVAGIAWEIGARDGSTWETHRTALRSVENVLSGNAGKMWSLNLIDRAIDEIKEAL